MNRNPVSKFKPKPSKPKTKNPSNLKPTITTIGNTIQPPSNPSVLQVQEPPQAENAPTTSEPRSPLSLLPTLTPALDILSRFHHRNKNQHRLSKWWAEADMLRRHLRKLIEAANEWCDKMPEREARRRKDELKRKKKKEKSERLGKMGKQEKEEEEKVEEDKEEEDMEAREVRLRAEYLRGKLGPRAYFAFSQLSADRQFAHLGLMLLGVLAQVDKALSTFASVPIDGDNNDDDAAAHEAATEAVKTTAIGKSRDDAHNHRHNDVGVAVSREELLAMMSTSGTGTPDSRPPVEEDTLARRGRDARDQPLPTTETEYGEPAAAGENRQDKDKSEKKNKKKRSRDTYEDEDEDEDDSFSFSEPTSAVPEKKTKSKKKRRIGDGDGDGNGDDIDDIFASFDKPRNKENKDKKASKSKTTAIETAIETTASTTTTSAGTTTSIATATATSTKMSTTTSAAESSAAAPVPSSSEAGARAGASKDDFDDIFASLEKKPKKKTTTTPTTKPKKTDDLDDIFASFDKPKAKKSKSKKKKTGEDEFDDIFGGL